MNGAWIQITETRTRTDEGRYIVGYFVNRAYAVPVQIFVLRAEDRSYSHVATVDDILTLPIDRSEALRASVGFYRDPGVSVEVESLDALRALTTHVRERVNELARAWDDGATQPEVPGENTFTFGGGA